MRTSLAARSVALLTTGALALGLASLPAEATEPAPDLRTFSISSNVIGSATSTPFFGTVTLDRQPASPITSATTQVRVNDHLVGSVPLIIGANGGGVDIPRGWGAGTVRLGPTTFTYQDGTSSTSLRTTTFDALRDVRTTRKDNVALTVRRSGDTVRVRVRQLKIIRPYDGTYRSLGTVRLQQGVDGTWRTKATIRLDASGNGRLTLRTEGSYRYRLLSPATSSKVEFHTGRTSRI